MTARSLATVSSEVRREQVRARYGKIALGDGCGCTSGTPGGCCSAAEGSDAPSQGLGYRGRDLDRVPPGADMGLGCGNPTALLALRPGDVVLDLGSGGGIDCFLAAKKVGARGRVIGVDMTPEMLAKARANARRGRYRNVEFRLGEVEHLPVADASIDVILSNCVINLAPDKAAVFREAFRVLRPGGRLAVSDMVATRPIPARARADPELWGSCSSGALSPRKLQEILRSAGFREIEIDPKTGPVPASLVGPGSLGVVAADIRASKPRE